MKRKNTVRLINGTIALVLLTAGYGIGRYTKTDTQLSRAVTETVTVESGDSLWSIAEQYAEGDIREYVSKLKRINDLDSAIIYPGQEIKVVRYK